MSVFRFLRDERGIVLSEYLSLLGGIVTVGVISVVVLSGSLGGVADRTLDTEGDGSGGYFAKAGGPLLTVAPASGTGGTGSTAVSGGGSTTGGSVKGGSKGGGSTSGGSTSGGTTTGSGTMTGGSSTGGSGTDVAATGGTTSGTTTTGGSTTGGSSTDGSTTGGTTSGGSATDGTTPGSGTVTGDPAPVVVTFSIYKTEKSGRGSKATYTGVYAAPDRPDQRQFCGSKASECPRTIDVSF